MGAVGGWVGGWVGGRDTNLFKTVKKAVMVVFSGVCIFVIFEGVPVVLDPNSTSFCVVRELWRHLQNIIFSGVVGGRVGKILRSHWGVKWHGGACFFIP